MPYDTVRLCGKEVLFMSAEEIFKAIRGLIVEQFAVSAESVTMESSFVDDFGADSVDLVELVMAIEEEFDVGEIPEDELSKVRTVGDCVRYIVELSGR